MKISPENIGFDRWGNGVIDPQTPANPAKASPRQWYRQLKCCRQHAMSRRSERHPRAEGPQLAQCAARPRRAENRTGTGRGAAAGMAQSAAVQSYGGRDAATGAAAVAPAAEIRQSEILLRMETRMSSAASGCGPWVLGAVSSSRRRSGLEAARCARNAPPHDQQSQSQLLVEILVTRCRAYPDDDQISACDDIEPPARRGTMHSLGQIELSWVRPAFPRS